MKVIPIHGGNHVYTSNVYLVLGEWKRIQDVSTLVDVGNDPSIVEVLSRINMGVGKNKVEQVILTHDHSDHTGILSLIREAFRPRVYAFSPFLEGVDHVLRHGDTVRLGDSVFEVIHTPGHSSDSISLYNPDQGILFVGDTPVIIRATGGAYEAGFYDALKTLCSKKINAIYFGHGEPLTENVHEMLMMSLRNVGKGLGRNFQTDGNHKHEVEKT